MKTASRKIEFQLGHRSRGGVRGAGLALATAALAAVGFVVRIPALAESKGSGAGAWLPAAPMLQGRESFTATALKNGKVLVAGTAFGTPEGPGDPTKTALLYDPVKNAWTQTAPMITPRTIHSAALLADGRVLVAGGGGISGFLNTAEIYDPSTEKWSQAGTIGQGGRHWHTATLLNNGKVLVTGGRDQSHATSYTDAWLYEPKSNNWTATGSFEVGRRSHTATLLSDGAVLITGGQLSGHDPSLKDALIYDPGAGVFKPVPSLMNEGRATHTATMLPGGKVLLAGGKNQLVG
ncbi:MAG: Kelch repeat-containing protein, partial [Actinomycetota bacterium]